VIDLSTEHPLSLLDACRIVPPGRGGCKCHISTLVRWITRGCRAPSGELVRLRAARLGSRWITSHEAIAEYMAALTPTVGSPVQPQPPRTPGRRQRAAQRAADQLSAIGI
jgi:hypothetical protein